MNMLKNIEALNSILLGDNQIRDNLLVELRVYYDQYTPCLELQVKSGILDSLPIFKLVFYDLVEFEYSFCKSAPIAIEEYKLLFDASRKVFYCSLDPDMSDLGVSKNDNNRIISNDIAIFYV